MAEDIGKATVIIRERRAQAVWRLLGCLLFVAVGCWAAWMIQDKRVPLVGATAFFAILIPRWAWSLARPGYLRISHVGLEQDLGWRRRFWSWDQICDVVLYKFPVGSATAVLIRQKGHRLPMRLFGWVKSPAELKRLIDGYRPAAG